MKHVSLIGGHQYQDPRVCFVSAILLNSCLAQIPGLLVLRSSFVVGVSATHRPLLN